MMTSTKIELADQWLKEGPLTPARMFAASLFVRVEMPFVWKYLQIWYPKRKVGSDHYRKMIAADVLELRKRAR